MTEFNSPDIDVTIEQSQALIAHGKLNIMPVASVEEMMGRYQAIIGFVKTQLVENIDFGSIPGCSAKPVLLLPGAQKVASFFGLYPTFTLLKEIFDVPNQFFFFRYKCSLFRDGELRGEGIGNINSLESKYGYRWVEAHELPANMDKSKLERKETTIGEFQFAIDKAQTDGKYGKPIAYWQAFRKAIAENKAVRHERPTKSGAAAYWEIHTAKYRIPNPDIFNELNTMEKMACKRAYIAAVLMATGTSQFFTQDLEERETQHTDQPAVAIDTTTKGINEPVNEPKQVPIDVEENKNIVNRILFFKDMFAQLGHDAPPKPSYVIGNSPKDFVTETIKNYLTEIRSTFAELLSGMLYDASQSIPEIKVISTSTIETMKLKEIKATVVAFNTAVAAFNSDVVGF